AAHDGLALSVAMQGRVAESVGLFEKALAVARQSGSDRSVVGSAQYNLACAYAEAGNFRAAAAALGEAIQIDAKYRRQAHTDDSFRKAWDRPEFRGKFE